ncbi:chitotriosidase-1-like [Ornithodoros turicata]|uniref:chitotriosidase-1-like n=1 Tax=Ornithodoros turicata TaxID=34597 RepID=UPI00313868BB
MEASNTEVTATEDSLYPLPRQDIVPEDQSKREEGQETTSVEISPEGSSQPEEPVQRPQAGPLLEYVQDDGRVTARSPSLYAIWFFAFLGGSSIVIVSSLFVRGDSFFGQRPVTVAKLSNVIPWYWNRDDLSALGFPQNFDGTSSSPKTSTDLDADSEVPDALRSNDSFCYRQFEQENDTAFNDTGPEFVAPPVSRKQNHHVVCVLNRTSLQRTQPYAFYPRLVALRYCTHVIYHSPLASDGARLAYRNPAVDRDHGMDEVRRAAERQRFNVSFLVSIGGHEVDNLNWSRLVSKKRNFQPFADDVLEVLKTHSYDGVNLDWFYPGGRCGTPSDVSGFTSLVQHLKSRLTSSENSRTYFVSIMLPYQERHLDYNYQLKPLSGLVDLLIVRTHDMCGPGSPRIRCPSPYEDNFGPALKTTLMMLSVKVYHAYWTKVCVSVSLMATTFTFDGNGSNSGLLQEQSAIKRTGRAGFFEVCDWEERNSSTVDNQCSVRGRGDTVAVFEDRQDLKRKLRRMLQEGYGAMCVAVFDIDTDDSLGKCKGNDGLMSPLLRAVYEGS